MPFSNASHRAVALAALFTLGASAHAAEFDFSGQIAHHKDRVTVDFTVDDVISPVAIWTDSWQSGLNFDPQLSLWRDGVLLAANDDRDNVGAGQGYYDAAITRNLLAGSYRLVLSASGNDALGNTLAAGFTYDGDAAIALADWTQPGSDINAGDQKGGAWSVHLMGVTQAAAVPEPTTYALMFAGLAAVLWLARRNRNF